MIGAGPGSLVAARVLKGQGSAPALIEAHDGLKTQVEELENRDRLGWQGLQQFGGLRVRLRAAEALAA